MSPESLEINRNQGLEKYFISKFLIRWERAFVQKEENDYAQQNELIICQVLFLNFSY